MSEFEGLFWFLYVIACVTVGFFCAWLAEEKNRGFTNWFFLGLLFGPLALLTLVGAPALDTKPVTTQTETRESLDIEFN